MGLLKSIDFSIASSPINFYFEFVSPGAVRAAMLIAESMGERLFPDTTKWFFDLSNPESCEIVTMLLWSNVRALSLGSYDRTVDMEDTMPIFYRIRNCCGGLEQLSIDLALRDLGAAFLEQLVETLVSLKHLRKLTLHPSMMSHPIVWQAIQSCSLNAVHTARYEGCISTALTFAAASEGISELRLNMTYEAALSLFTSSPPMPNLENISLEVHGVTEVDRLDILSEAVCNASACIARLSLHWFGQPSPLKAEFFAPISPLKLLTDIDLHVAGMDALTDDDFEVLFSGSPGLIHICITPTTYSDAVCATLMTLSHIAKHCRRVRSVGIRLNAKLDRLPSSSTSLAWFTTSLTFLHMEYSPLDDALSVALVLSRLCQFSAPEIASGGLHQTNLGDERCYEDSYGKAPNDQLKWSSVASMVARLQDFVNGLDRVNTQRIQE
jgi:hypothetical protein